MGEVVQLVLIGAGKTPNKLTLKTSQSANGARVSKHGSEQITMKFTKNALLLN